MTKIIENEPGVVWCKPWGEDQGEYVRVNVADFDPDFHQLLDAEPAPAELTAAQLKEKLTELGVEFKGNASKAALQELYNAAVAAVDAEPEAAAEPVAE